MLFYWYEFSRAYRKMSYAERAGYVEGYIQRITTYDNDYLSWNHCERNSIEANSEEEGMAYWLKYNVSLFDMLYYDFKVDYISNSFYEAARQNVKRLIQSTCERGVYDTLGRSSGVMIVSDFLVRYAVQKEGVLLLTQSRSMDYNGGSVIRIFGNKWNADSIEGNEPNKYAQAGIVALAILILKKCGEIETQLIGAGVRRKSLDTGEVIKNCAPFPITQVDSSWLKTIVRTEGFLVRGHFRLQACGEKHRDRKLTYINPFQKHGYVRRAKRIVAEERAYAAA